MAAGSRLWVVVGALVAASAVSIMSTDMYTPSLPSLPAYFATSAQAAKLTITLNLLAFGLAQLVLGPVSDRYGRRPVMLAGLVTFTVFSAACALAQSISALIVFRVLQGISGSVEAVVGLAIIRDLFDETDQVRVLAIWGMAIAIAPAAAPVIGGYVHVAWGWQANFWIVAALGAVTAVLIWRVLPESAQRDGYTLRPRALARSYASLLANRRFMSYVVILGACLGLIFAFITAGPFILIEQHGVRTEHYGYYQGAIVMAFFAGSLVANALARRIRLEQLLRSGLAVTACGALAIPALLAAGALTPLSLTSAMALCALGMGPIFAVAPSFALRLASARVGAGAALIGSGQMLMCAAAAGLVTVLHDGTALALAVAVSILLLAAAAAWRLGQASREAAAA